jgi:Flp pilus assembly pilin Flp
MRSRCCRALGFRRDEGGPTAAEYAILPAVLIGVCRSALSGFGTDARNTFGNVAGQAGGTAS